MPTEAGAGKGKEDATDKFPNLGAGAARPCRGCTWKKTRV